MTTERKNPFTYAEDPDLYSVVDRLLDHKKKADARLAKALAIGEIDGNAGFKKLHPCKIDLVNYRARRTASTWQKTSLDIIDAEVVASIKAAENTIAGVTKLNEPLIEHNQRLCNKIKELMTSLGISAYYTTYEYATTRSKTRTAKNHTAGYLTDLTRVCPVSETQAETYKLRTYIDEYNRWVVAEKEADLKEKVAKDTHAFTKYVLENPTLVENLMKAGVNVLAETRNAVTGNKLDIVKYCIAQAVSNLEAQPDPDEDLIEALRTAI